MATENLTTERWLPVVGYEGIYSVSDMGRVRSEAREYVDSAGRHRRVSPLVVSQRNRNGYLAVRLWSAGVGRDFHVHRLVAAAFLSRGETHAEVNHFDGVKANNAATNLEWVTQGENIAHAVRHGLYPSGDRNGSRLHPERLVRGDRHGARLHPEALARGEAHGRTRLTEDDVRTIRRRYAAGGVSLPALGREYGMAFSAIGRIVNRKTWQHVA